MGRMNEQLFALNVGGVDKEALARIDLEKMRLAGVHPVKNFLPRVLGPMALRPGLEHLYAMPGNNTGRAIPFIFSRLVNYDLIFTDGEMRIEQDGALLQVADSGSAVLNPDFDSAFAGSYATGWVDDSDTGTTATISGGKLTFVGRQSSSAKAQQSMAIAPADQDTLHTLRLVVDRGPIFLRIGSTANGEDLVTETKLDTGTHKITFTPTVATIFVTLRAVDDSDRIIDQVTFEHTALGGAGDLVVPTPWDADQLEKLRWFQSANTLFIADGEQQQYKVERRSDRSWSVVEYKSIGGPFASSGIDHITMTPSGNDGNVTITASEDYFSADDVGSLIELSHERYDREELLDGPDQVTSHITVRGVGADNREFGRGATASGFSGTLTLERSFDAGEPINWQVHTETTSTTVFNTTSDGNDNLIVHYRYNLKAGNYNSGSMNCRLFYKGQNVTGRARIIGYVSPTVVNVEVIDFFGHSIATRDWRIGDWSTRRGWPRVPLIYDGRLYWFRNDEAFGSVSDDFTNFDSDVDGDSGPIKRSVGSGSVEGVLWALGLQRLVAGTTGFEASIRASSFDEPLTRTAFTVKDASTLGSADVPAIKHDTGAFYVDSSEDRLNELFYSVQGNDYTSRDLTRLLPNAFDSGFKRLAVQRRPDTRLYCLLNDGTCAVMTFDRADEVIAFTTIEAANSGFIEDVTVRRGRTRDYVTFIVRRTVDSATVRYREQLANEREQKSKSTCVLLDSAAVYSGVATTTAAALCAHLVGETVRVFADGAYVGEQVVPANGDITVGTAAVRIVAGLKYTASFESVKLAYAGGLGTAIGQKKRVARAGLLLSNSCIDGLKVGRDANNLQSIPKKYDGRTLNADELLEHYDHNLPSVPSGWSVDSRIYVQAEGPWPCTAQAINFEIETLDNNPPPPNR